MKISISMVSIGISYSFHKGGQMYKRPRRTRIMTAIIAAVLAGTMIITLVAMVLPGA